MQGTAQRDRHTTGVAGGDHRRVGDHLQVLLPGSGEQSDDRPLRLSGERNEAHLPFAGALDLEGCRR